jgi:uncharacterized membrane protein
VPVTSYVTIEQAVAHHDLLACVRSVLHLKKICLGILLHLFFFFSSITMQSVYALQPQQHVPSMIHITYMSVNVDMYCHLEWDGTFQL